ncbi:hypothetical protein ACUY2E_09525 [Corynebacterium confusum]|uniref:hypothetical protein n=1 Tax=uncultured Corynebacterium sp. TaxID=159447 RepID=UPI0025F8F739|nr:hypothetical protein [uncultured Corynebacterium sp.]
MGTALLVAVAVVVTGVMLWAYFTAQRLNTLHIRTDAALAQLQAALDRRAAVAAALEPRLAEVSAQAETTALVPGQFTQRSDLEHRLGEEIRRVCEPPPAQLVDAEVRVQLAHRFYNEAVADTRALRLRPLVRTFRLGGTARLPEFFDLTAF